MKKLIILSAVFMLGIASVVFASNKSSKETEQCPKTECCGTQCCEPATECK